MKIRRVYLLGAIGIFLVVVFAAVVATSHQAYRLISYQSAPHRYWIINSSSGLLFFSVQTGVRRDPGFRSAAFDFTGGYYPEGNSNGWAVTTVAIPYWLILVGPWVTYTAVRAMRRPDFRHRWMSPTRVLLDWPFVATTALCLASYTVWFDVRPGWREYYLRFTRGELQIWTPHPVGEANRISFWLIVLASLIWCLSAHLWKRNFVPQLHIGEPRMCETCGGNLAGTISGRCPECGTDL